MVANKREAGFVVVGLPLMLFIFPALVGADNFWDDFDPTPVPM